MAWAKQRQKGTQEIIWHCKALHNSVEAVEVIRSWQFGCAVSFQQDLGRDLGSAESNPWAQGLHCGWLHQGYETETCTDDGQSSYHKAISRTDLFFALLCAVSEVSHPRVFPVLWEEMELWCRIWTAVCCKLMTSPWSKAGVKRGKSHKLDCESCDGSC